MKNLVVFYSRKGSNRFLAARIAQSLSCETVEIHPRINSFFLFLFNFNPGIWRIRKQLAEYDRVILVGPIWMGRFIPPLRSFVKRYGNQVRKLVFVTCCGSTYDKKDEKFGHGHVFRQVETLLDGKCEACQAFPIGLVLPEEHREDSDAFMNTHLNEENFRGEVVQIYDRFIATLAG
ncbi:MAG: flavodoxin domain-containing protein [Bacteroidota bacterium]